MIVDTGSDPRHILVTGATGGIGSAVCRRLATRGWSPLIGHRAAQAEAARVLARECGGLALELDLNDPLSIDQALGEVSALTGRFLGVVHCASPAPSLAPLGRVSDEDMEMFWRANVLGPQRLLSGLIKHRLRKARQGVVVAVLSAAMGDAKRKAMPGMGAYTISKFGLCGVLALLESENPWLRVARVNPGFTKTRMLSAFDERFIELAAAQTPLAEPEDVAEEIMRQLEGE